VCGRYASDTSDFDLTWQFEVQDVLDEAPGPSWNVAPTDPVRIVVQRSPHGTSRSGSVRQLRTARWGLVPSWSRDRRGAAMMINARIETVTQKPAFRAAAARRRCLIPALGYYEWQKTGQGKIPYFLHDPDGGVLAMAGLYEFWRDPGLPADDPTRWLWTCTIITQPATDLLGQIHDRSPVVVPPDLRADWLDCSSDDAGTASGLLARVPAARLEPYVVSAAVGNVRNNGPELVAPVDVASPGYPV
jgi:putative SOS response-associated peptidase YedK